MKLELRPEAENYISKKAAIAGYKALATNNLKQASDMTVANLYWYFQAKAEIPAAG